VSRLVEVDGARLAVHEAGHGSPPFVFIHGLACDHTSWQPQFEDLSRDHRCLAIDLRGRGESSAEPPFHTTRQADDVAAVMRALDVEPAILAGHSLGGITALLVNDRHPPLVRGIVACDSPLGPGSLGEGAGRLAERIRLDGPEALRPLLESFWGETTTDSIREYVLALMLGCPAEVTAGMLENDAPVAARALEIVRAADTRPFMAIWAARPLGDVRWLREATVFLRHEPVVGAGHFLQLEQPAITTALLRAFLDDVRHDPRVA
jgi:pimeloyl-ACP methyl ester carboxylesterase